MSCKNNCEPRRHTIRPSRPALSYPSGLLLRLGRRLSAYSLSSPISDAFIHMWRQKGRVPFSCHLATIILWRKPISYRHPTKTHQPRRGPLRTNWRNPRCARHTRCWHSPTIKMFIWILSGKGTRGRDAAADTPETASDHKCPSQDALGKYSCGPETGVRWISESLSRCEPSQRTDTERIRIARKHVHRIVSLAGGLFVNGEQRLMEICKYWRDSPLDWLVAEGWSDGKFQVVALFADFGCGARVKLSQALHSKWLMYINVHPVLYWRLLLVYGAPCGYWSQSEDCRRCLL